MRKIYKFLSKCGTDTTEELSRMQKYCWPLAFLLNGIGGAAVVLVIGAFMPICFFGVVCPALTAKFIRERIYGR